MTNNNSPQRVLVTGSAGAIGATVCEALLARGYYVRGIDLLSSPDLEDSMVGDLADRETVFRAVDRVGTVIHLAAYIDTGDLVDILLRPNVIAPYYVCEAARELGVRRLVLTSSVQVIEGFGHPGRSIGVDEGLKPRNLYALTKAWGEVMGEMYAVRYNLSVINVRVGWLPRSQQQADHIASSTYGQNIYLSFADAARFFVRCVESDSPKRGECITVFAGSRSKETPHMDLEPARELLGYVPEDTWPDNMPFAVA